ncbi:hypothetical protein LCGC14_1166640 [marine sediment metagenome]|uniref:Uncharacterized protein n=1 Tax=marine sediment metagenome TaxID=412755 RepID=A0A0F9ME14_9ZZZZ
MSRLEELMEKQRALEATTAALPADELTLAQQVLGNSRKLEDVAAAETALLDIASTEVRRLEYDVYRPKIQLLEHERDDRIEQVNRECDEARDEKQKEKEALGVVVDQASRIIEFLRVDDTRNLAVVDDDVQVYRDREKENLGYLFDDAWLGIKLYIVGNAKPKNRFSLVAIGQCLFGDRLLKLSSGYGADLNYHHHASLLTPIRDAPSIADHLAWLDDSRRQKLIVELTGDYEKVKAEYLDVLAAYERHDFEELMTDQCECGYFYTILDNISRRDEPITCPRCQHLMAKGEC